MPLSAELGRFLRSRRGRVDPSSAGIVGTQRRRTPGLRREEVATLAGVSVSWYTWLEQGRQVQPSKEVLGALARTLQLSASETAYLFVLADLVPPQSPPAPWDPATPAVAGYDSTGLLGALVPSPAYGLDNDWFIVAWNEPMRTLYPQLETLDHEHRHLLRILCDEPAAQGLIADCDAETLRVLSQIRMTLAEMGAHDALEQVVADVRARHPRVDRWWSEYEVGNFEDHERAFLHPDAGPLRFRQVQMRPDGNGLDGAAVDRVVIHLPIPGDDSTARLAAVGVSPVNINSAVRCGEAP